jgi:protein-glutamine gamma-glutamyltransferase
VPAPTSPGALVRRKRQHPVPEDSIRLRAVALAAVMVSAIALVAQDAVDPGTGAGALALIPVGFVFSHLRRARRNTIFKLGLAAAMCAALWSFIQTVRTAPSVDDARAALASLFLWTQVLHSFDLPRRRDLALSVVASLILLAEAGSLSLGSGFAVFLVPYAAVAGAWLYLSNRLDDEKRAARTAVLRDSRRPRRAKGNPVEAWGLLRPLAVTTAAVMLAGTMVFLAAPRMNGFRVVAPPFSITRKVVVPGFGGAVVNRGLPSQGGTGSASSNGGYPGFGQSVDLGVRFHLSDRVVMKVRAQQAAFWRAQAYDTFDGQTWTVSGTSIEEQSAGFEPPIKLAPPVEAVESILSGGVRSSELTQTFYVLVSQPNVVFAAYQPKDLYFPLNRVAVDSYGSVRTPLFLEADTIYSVVSEVPSPTVAELRASPRTPTGLSAELLGRYELLAAQYTQLPDDLSPRVLGLAHEITDGAPTTYDKVIAIQDWLKANTRYNLDIPPDPLGTNPVDEFLFHRRQGYCEHFSTAMIMLLRAVGVPSRFAVGFDSGARNPFTGYFEVRESDAHSWVEVFYPGVGWIEYDPTHDVPQANPGLAGRFIAPQVFRAIGRFLVHLVPGPVKAVASAVGSALASALRRLPVGARILGSCSVLGALWAIRRRRRRPRSPPGTLPVEAFRSMCMTFAARGNPRPPHRTANEHLLALLANDRLAHDARADLELIVRTFEQEAFSGERAGLDEGRLARDAAGRVRGLASAHRR